MHPVSVGGSCKASKSTLSVDYMPARGDNSTRYEICFDILNLRWLVESLSLCAFCRLVE